MPKPPKRQPDLAKDMPWDEAIRTVLAKEGEPMHYTHIADSIIKDKLRVNVGATPPTTVAVILNQSLNREATGDGVSPYMKVSKGVYALKAEIETKSKAIVKQTQAEEETSSGAVRAFGMFCSGDEVSWDRTPKLLGRFRTGATDVNFANQVGVYLLHDRDRVVYVGRTDAMFARLKDHTGNRLSGRWDRFSWFGLRAVAADGSLADGKVPWSQDVVVATMEALLIESLEPPLNRRRGDGLEAFEYLQVPDPNVQDARLKLQLLQLRPR